MKLRIIWNILRNRPVIYRVSFEDCLMEAGKNNHLISYKSYNVTLDAGGYEEGIWVDGKLV